MSAIDFARYSLRYKARYSRATGRATVPLDSHPGTLAQAGSG